MFVAADVVDLLSSASEVKPYGNLWCYFSGENLIVCLAELFSTLYMLAKKIQPSSTKEISHHDVRANSTRNNVQVQLVQNHRDRPKTSGKTMQIIHDYCRACTSFLCGSTRFKTAKVCSGTGLESGDKKSG